jgi:hypothetical protein
MCYSMAVAVRICQFGSTDRVLRDEHYPTMANLSGMVYLRFVLAEQKLGVCIAARVDQGRAQGPVCNMAT